MRGVLLVDVPRHMGQESALHTLPPSLLPSLPPFLPPLHPSLVPSLTHHSQYFLMHRDFLHVQRSSTSTSPPPPPPPPSPFIRACPFELLARFELIHGFNGLALTRLAMASCRLIEPGKLAQSVQPHEGLQRPPAAKLGEWEGE